MGEAEDARFLAVATPALALATLLLRSCGRTGPLRTPQREFLDRCGPWATPALGAWMATATGLTAVAPLVLTRRAADRDARSTVRPIAFVLAAQVGLEAALGALSDKSHPVTGLVFSLHRLRQVRRAQAAIPLARAPRVRRLLDLQAWFWRTNVLMLLATAAGRTVMRPGSPDGGSRAR